MIHVSFLTKNPISICRNWAETHTHTKYIHTKYTHTYTQIHTHIHKYIQTHTQKSSQKTDTLHMYTQKDHHRKRILEFARPFLFYHIMCFFAFRLGLRSALQGLQIEKNTCKNAQINLIWYIQSGPNLITFNFNF